MSQKTQNFRTPLIALSDWDRKEKNSQPATHIRQPTSYNRQLTSYLLQLAPHILHLTTQTTRPHTYLSRVVML